MCSDKGHKLIVTMLDMYTEERVRGIPTARRKVGCGGRNPIARGSPPPLTRVSMIPLPVARVPPLLEDRSPAASRFMR